MEIYYHDSNGERVGPISAKKLKELAMFGEISETTIVELGPGKVAAAKKIKGLSFPEKITVPAVRNPPAPSIESQHGFPQPTNPHVQNPFSYDTPPQPQLHYHSYPVHNPAYSAPSKPKSRLIYILLALFFFGPIGSHNFYAKRYTHAVLQLILGSTGIGLLVTCFWAILDAIFTIEDGDGIEFD